jgi:hypothetical protein
LLTGTDETGPVPVGTTFEAGSSKTEPGVTPAQGIDLVYTKWSEIQDACGMSRLHGGMHFSKSVPAGQELCTGVASVVVNRAEMLRAGNSEGALADLDDTSIVVKKRRVENSEEGELAILFNDASIFGNKKIGKKNGKRK